MGLSAYARAPPSALLPDKSARPPAPLKFRRASARAVFPFEEVPTYVPRRKADVSLGDDGHDFFWSFDFSLGFWKLGVSSGTFRAELKCCGLGVSEGDRCEHLLLHVSSLRMVRSLRRLLFRFLSTIRPSRFRTRKLTPDFSFVYADVRS